MRKLLNRLIVSDFDGTLITDNQQILPEVRAAIDEYVACGGIFAVCTGRMLASILPQVRALGLKGMVVAHQGTVIAEIESGKIIKNGGISCEGIAEICRNIEQLNQPVNIYADDYIYSDIPKDNKYLQLYEKIIGVETTYVDGKISDFVLKNKLLCQKVSILVAESERDGLYKELCARLGEKYDVTCSAKVLIEISAKEENKGEAVKFLAKHFGIPLNLSVAVGDNLNDMSMIKVAGTGVAVGNAEPALKSAADYVSVSNNDGAVAQIIEKFGFA